MPFGDEVVRAIDVEVVHRLVDLDPLDVGDDVELAVARRPSPCPARTDDAGMNGSELAVASSPFAARRAMYRTRTSSTPRIRSTISAIAPMSALPVSNRHPREPSRAGRTLSPSRSSACAPFVVVAEQRDPVERATAPAIAAEHDGQPPTRYPGRGVRVPVRGVMRVVEAQILVGKEPYPAFSVSRSEKTESISA